MAPPKKKRRLASASAADGDKMDDSSEDTHETTSTRIASKDLLTKQLIDQLDALESGNNLDASNTAASVSLLRLKSLQRSLLEKVRQTQELLRKQALARDQQELRLENLRYQHTIHQSTQKNSDGAVESTALEIARLVRRSTAAVAKETKGDGDDETGKVLRNFLGEDWRDPSNRPTIVAKLNHEVATRKKLEAELNKLRANRTSNREALTTRQKLLRDLPSKLADMEKASLPLQKFCQRQSAVSSLMKTTPKLGTTKRHNRLDLAKRLPKALYTLFHQLQSCLDVLETNPQATDISPEALPAVEIQTGSSSESNLAVLLKVPVPTLSSGGTLSYKPKKQATVAFRYDSGLDVVLAACGTDYDMGPGVIDELFPGDRGDFLEGTPEAAAGRSYQWSNYLAGLLGSPADQKAVRMRVSARVILRALVRRIRATATLSWILHGLSRKPSLSAIPRHPSLKDEDEEDDGKSATRLSSWTALETTTEKGSGGFVRGYKAILQHGGGKAAKKVAAKVSIDLSRYPSSIPQWKILSSPNRDREMEEDSLDVLRGGEAPRDLPLYNEALARLEQEVNHKVDELVVPSDQTTYDWILAQQLVKIGKSWEDSLQKGAS